MAKIKCSCGKNCNSKLNFIIHILTLDCYDENLNFKK